MSRALIIAAASTILALAAALALHTHRTALVHQEMSR